jgi:hypothetical protein
MHARFKKEPLPADHYSLGAPQGAFFREIGQRQGYNPKRRRGFRKQLFAEGFA